MLGARFCQSVDAASRVQLQSPRPNRMATGSTRMSAKKSIDLEKALSDLEEIVDELESGELPLEKAMKKFEDGVKLTRRCQAALKEAEQKVEILLKSAGGDDQLEEFVVDED